MSHGGGLAEIRLLPHQMSLYGSVTRLNEQSIAVRLRTVPTAPAMLQPGTETQIVCTCRGSFLTACATILGQEGGDLILGFQRAQSEAARTDRRHERRVQCSIPGQYRAIRRDGRAGAWQDTTIVDLGMTGICILLEPRAEVPARLELRFRLGSTDPWADGRGDDAGGMDDDGRLGHFNDSRTSRVVGRTVHCGLERDGRIRVGLAFIALGATDRDRLVRFTDDAEHTELVAV